MPKCPNCGSEYSYPEGWRNDPPKCGKCGNYLPQKPPAKLMDYKGYEIQVNEAGEFQAIKDGAVVFKDSKLEKLKKQIDGQPVPVIVHLRGDFREGKITSTSEKDGKCMAWVSCLHSNPDGREEWVAPERAKTQLEQLIKPTDENRKIVEQITQLKQQQGELIKQAVAFEDSISELENRLERFTAKDFGLGEKG